METKRKIDEIAIYSDEVKDILERPSGKLLRWGNTLFFGIVVTLLMASCFIKYPDSIYANIIITTTNPPASVVAKRSGVLSRLLVKENEHVAKNEILAIIESSCNYTHLQTVKQILLGYDPNIAPAMKLALPVKINLGALQEDYLEFERTYNAYLLQMELEPEQYEIVSLQRSLKEHRELLAKLEVQKENLTEDLQLTEKDLERNKLLLEAKVIANKEFEDKQKLELESKRLLNNAKIAINNTQINVIELEKTIRQLNISGRKNIAVLQQQLIDAYKKLQNSITTWEDDNLLKSPVDGKITFFKYWSEHQYVKANEDVFTVVPEKQEQVIGKMTMPVLNSGKVRPGNRIIISLDNYPQQEYGHLEGVLQHVSLVPRENQYAMEVSLPRQLRTNNKRVLEFKQEMSGKAEIITENRSILTRIFEKITSKIDR